MAAEFYGKEYVLFEGGMLNNAEGECGACACLLDAHAAGAGQLPASHGGQAPACSAHDLACAAGPTRQQGVALPARPLVLSLRSPGPPNSFFPS